MAGGKSRELDVIWKYMPKTINRFYEPFVGGGAVFWAMPDNIEEFFINDKSQNYFSYSLQKSDKILFRS